MKAKKITNKIKLNDDDFFQIIEKLIVERDRLKEILYEIFDIWGVAYKAYNEPKIRQDERARAVLKILGFSKDGKKTAKILPDILFYKYLELTHIEPEADYIKNIMSDKNLRPMEPISETDAIIQIARERNMTANAVRQHINRYIIKQRSRCKSKKLPTTGLKTPPKI